MKHKKNAKKVKNILKILIFLVLLVTIYLIVNKAIMSKYTIRMQKQDSYYAGGSLILNVNAYKEDYSYSYYSSSPRQRLSKKIQVELFNSDDKKIKDFKYTGKTDSENDTEIGIKIPENLDEGDYTVVVKTKELFGNKRTSGKIKIYSTNNKDVVISLDKGIYKPGDDISYRALILSKNDNKPIEKENTIINIFDGNGNKVYTEKVESTEFGVVSGKFTLADEVNSGTYKIEVVCKNESSEKSFNVNPYVTPQFETKISTDKEVYKTGETAHITFDSKYFFGEPVKNAQIKYSINGEEHENYSDENGILETEYTAEKNGEIFVLCQVTDSSNYMVEASKKYSVSNELINIEMIPEYGGIIKSMDNTIYVFAKDASGKPIKTYNSISFDNVKKEVITDENGVGKFIITQNEVPKTILGEYDYSSTYDTYDNYYYGNNYRNNSTENRNALKIKINSKDMSSNTVSLTQNLNVIRTNSKIVSTDDVLYEQGDDINISIKNSDLNSDNTIYVMKNKQLVKICSFEGADTTINLEDTSGIIDLYEKDLANKRTIFVKPTKGIQIKVSGQEKTYGPGDTMNLIIDSNDNEGNSIDTNFLVSILDTAMLNLAENDLSIDNVKLALSDLVLTDGVSMADVYASVVENKSPEILMGMLVKQKTDIPVFSTSYEDYQIEERNAIELVVSIIVFILLIVAYLFIKFGDKAKKVFFDIINVIAFISITYTFIYYVVDLFGSVYPNENLILLASIAMGIALYILLGYKRREFIFDNVFKLAIIPYMVLVPNIILFMIMENVIGIVSGSVYMLIPIGEVVAYIVITLLAKKKGKTKLFNILKEILFASIGTVIFYVVVFFGYYNSNSDSVIFYVLFCILTYMIFNYVLFWESKRKSKNGTRIEDGKLILNINGAGMIVFTIISIIVLIPVGMYIYSSAQAQVNNSITNMSTSGVEDAAIDFTGMASTGSASREKSKSTNAWNNIKQNVKDVIYDEEVEDAEYTDADIDEEMDNIEVSQDTKKAEKVRSVFLESLAFIPDLVAKNGNVQKEIQLSDNITTWNMQIVGNTKNGDVGYTSTEFKVFKNFFVNYTLPTNAVVSDNVKIPVTVHNYTEKDLVVNINIPSISWGNIGEYAHDIALSSNATKMIYVPIEITKEGNNTLRVESKSDGVSDIVEKNLTVKRNGVEKSVVASTGIITDDYYQDLIYDDNAIENTRDLKVKIYPSDISIMVENIEGILRLPTGCFEQTSSSLYPDVLVLKYLETMEMDDENTKKKALDYISKGYQKLLTYEVPSTKGGYSLYGRAPAEPVITAFGLMEMKDVSEVYSVDEKVIENMKEYLFKIQKTNGSFNIGSTYIGGSSRADELAMNAYIVWCLSETCPEDSRLEKSVSYLENNLNRINNNYTLALIANVFCNTNNKNADVVLEKLSKNLDTRDEYNYLKTDSYDYYGSYGRYQDIQASALMVMALNKTVKDRALAEKLLNYIVSARDNYGTWGTTQSTILALKAINSGMTNDKLKDQTIKIKLNDEEKEIKIEKNSLSVYEVTFNNVDKENHLNIDMNAGKISYEVVKEYYETYEDAIKENSKSLNVSSSIATEGKVNSEITQSIHIENNGELITNGLIKIYIPQGSSVIEESLSKLKTMGYIEKYEYNYNTINLYIKNFDHMDSKDLDIRYRANYPVNVTGGMVMVYDYYNPDNMSIAAPQNIVITE